MAQLGSNKPDIAIPKSFSSILLRPDSNDLHDSSLNQNKSHKKQPTHHQTSKFKPRKLHRGTQSGIICRSKNG